MNCVKSLFEGDWVQTRFGLGSFAIGNFFSYPSTCAKPSAPQESFRSSHFNSFIGELTQFVMNGSAVDLFNF